MVNTTLSLIDYTLFTISSVTRNMFQTLRHKLVTIVVAVIVGGYGGGVTTVFMKVRHPTSCRNSFVYISATNSKYLSLCSRGAASLDLYTNCVHCSTFSWKQRR